MSPAPKKHWAVASGEDIKHFFLPVADYWVPCCDPQGTTEKSISDGDGEPKCLDCIEGEKGCL